MSAGEGSVGSTLLCQGILKKRKDKIRLRWVTYWFELHHATLLFYNTKQGSITDLRGQYYLIEIESVRELTWMKKKHYVFEIVMKNGKRKVLAAETEDLREQWMCQISQAINHQAYTTPEPNSNSEMAPDDMCSTHLNPCSVISNLEPEAPNSYLWSSNVPSAAAAPTTTPYIYIDSDMLPVESSQRTEDEVEQKAEETEFENDYDILPVCKSLHYEEVIYDTPPSNRRLSEHEHASTESIYDVPKFAFQRDLLNEEPCASPPEITGLLRDMVTCLGGNTADWNRATAPGAVWQP